MDQTKAEKVQVLATKIGEMLNGEDAPVCMTALCFLLAMGIGQLPPSADEEALKTAFNQISNSLNLLRAQDESQQEDTQIH